jgi:hypothetical protein
VYWSSHRGSIYELCSAIFYGHHLHTFYTSSLTLAKTLEQSVHRRRVGYVQHGFYQRPRSPILQCELRRHQRYLGSQRHEKRSYSGTQRSRSRRRLLRRLPTQDSPRRRLQRQASRSRVRLRRRMVLEPLSWRSRGHRNPLLRILRPSTVERLSMETALPRQRRASCLLQVSG